jgi:hypothetical protein
LVWVTALGVAIAATIWIGIPQWKLHKAHRDVTILAVALDGYAVEQHEYPHGAFADVCALLRGESVNGQNPQKLDYVEASAYEMNAAGEFIDPWGTPYRILTESQGRAYSCGPNRLDEHGDGDDIASWR